MVADGLMVPGCVGSIAPEEEPSGLTTRGPLCACLSSVDQTEKGQWGEFFDVNGNPLESRLVREARQEEVQEIIRRGVYSKVPLEECYRVTGKALVGIRFVDVNKGDFVCPNYRSRLVATQVKHDKSLDMFAAMPPLEAVKLLFCLCSTPQCVQVAFKIGFR